LFKHSDFFGLLEKSHRLLLEQELRPTQGERFQPTGFADIGAAVYELPNGTRKLLVESVQSMANRFEAVILNAAGELDEDFTGLPYLKAKITSENKTETFVTSLTEPHRINSPWFITDPEFSSEFCEKACYSKEKPLDWKAIGKALFRYDPNSLLHGCFLANLGDGRVKVPRALSGFIEAEEVKEAVSGGMKFSPIDPSGKLRSESYDKDVYGNVPFQRVEYTAKRITSYFSLDLSLLRGHALPPEAFELLVALGLFKAQGFLESGTRLRTACDLVRSGDLTSNVEGFALPTQSDLRDLIRERIKNCRDQKFFADPAVRLIEVKAIRKKPESQGEEPVEGHEEDE
jgi:CRISPR-associated protein Csb1